MTKFLVYCQNSSNGLKYVLDFISQQFRDLEFELSTSYSDYIQSNQFKLNYSDHRISNQELFIYNAHRLEEVSKIEFPDKFYKKDQCFLFSSNHEDDLGFDLFTAIFWMLTNYEERSTKVRDLHGRFNASHSFLYENLDFKRPLVDEWVDLLMDRMNDHFKLNLQRSQKFSWSVGIDIDQAWKYKNKVWWKSIGALIKNLIYLNFSEFKEQFSTLFLGSTDPFESFDYLGHFDFSKNQIIYFILNGNNVKYDFNHSINNIEYKKILKKLSENYMIALHPSYECMDNQALLKSQKTSLEKVVKQEIFSSRQHYLRLQLPKTYRNLLAAGIQNDYSMIYADQSGFRTGTSNSYYFFDVDGNQATTLRINPVLAMDRSYLQYMKLKPKEALDDIAKLIDLCKHYQGHFHFIWHNSSFDFKAEWKNWETIFPDIIKLLRP